MPKRVGPDVADAVWARDGAITLIWTLDLDDKLGMAALARRELVNLAQLCKQGVSHEWEFNEWHHGVTGRPMGKAFQKFLAGIGHNDAADLR